jgi:Pentapeptide repeats (8 copies)
MESEQKISRSWSKVLIILAIILSAFIICIFLWNVEQYNVNSLQDKIENFKKEAVQVSINNEQLKPEDRLKLKKDILVIEKDATTIQNGVYTPLIQVIGGAILSITAYVGYCNFEIGQKNLEVTEDKQVTERFSRSIEHLGSKEIEIRLGGIYALEQIAIDSTKYHWTIVEILSAFIREKRPINITNPVGIDIQAALTVIGGRKVKQDPNDKVIDLRKISLVGVELQNTNFSKADFSGTNLSNANLSGANLSEANLSLTDLIGVDLSNANLNGADLNNTRLDDSPQPYEYEYPEDPRYIIPPDYDSTAANLNGADLSTCKNLTKSQLIFVAKNENTKLPDYLNIPIA